MKRTTIVKVNSIPIEVDECSISDLRKELEYYEKKYPNCYLIAADEIGFDIYFEKEETDYEYKTRLFREQTEKEQLDLLQEYKERELYEKLKKKYG